VRDMDFTIDSFSFYKHFGKHWYKPANPVDIRWYCEKCLSLGAGGLHIDPYHIDIETEMEWVSRFAKGHRMYIELGACGTSYDELSPYIQNAGKYGIKTLRTFVGGSCLDERSIIRERTMAAKRGLKESLELAEKYDVRIAVENHGDLFIDDLISLLEIDSEYLGICFDSGNFAFTGEDPLDALAAFRGRIFCTHLKDACHVGKGSGDNPFMTVAEPIHFCPLGEGFIPVDKVIRQLVSDGLDRFTIEMCIPVVEGLAEEQQLSSEENAVCRSIDYIRKFI